MGKEGGMLEGGGTSCRFVDNTTWAGAGSSVCMKLSSRSGNGEALNDVG